MVIAASTVRQDIERNFATNANEGKEASNALLLALSRLLVSPNSDNQVGVAMDAHSSLLVLCCWDRGQDHCDSIARRVLSTIDMLWSHLQQLESRKKRKSSTSQMRIAALMVDTCLLGGDKMSWALSSGIDKLLHIALDYPNDDPLLQLSALDQLERLTVHNNVNAARVEFLLGHDILRRGLLCLVGSQSNLSKDTNNNDKWEDMDPINGVSAIRLLTEICHVGVMSSASVSKGIWKIFNYY